LPEIMLLLRATPAGADEFVGIGLRGERNLAFRDLSEALLAERRFMRVHHQIADGAANYATFQAGCSASRCRCQGGCSSAGG
jgi:hypothetical protein